MVLLPVLELDLSQKDMLRQLGRIILIHPLRWQTTFVRLFISIIVSHVWPLHQQDIMNAFFHGDHQEDVCGAATWICCGGGV